MLKDENNSPYELHQFSDDEKKAIIVKQICLGNLELSKFFFDTIDQKNAQELFKSMYGKKPPNYFKPSETIPNLTYYQWLISRLLMKYDENYEDKFDFSVFLTSEVLKMRSKRAGIFRQALYDVKPGEVMSVMRLIDAFYQLSHENYSVTRLYLPVLTPVFLSIPFQKIYQSYQLFTFGFFDSPSKLDIKSQEFVYTNAREYEELYQAQITFNDPCVAQIIENSVVSQRFYPDLVLYETTDYYRSLLETSIVKEIHFVDLIRVASKELFDKDNMNDSIKQTEQVPELQSWIYLSHFSDFLSSTKQLPKVESTFKVKSNATELIDRLHNDKHLFSRIRRLTGSHVDLKEFVNNSMPYVLQPFLLSLNPAPFENISDKLLFCISDQDRLKDADFVWSYFAVANALKYVLSDEIDEDSFEILDEAFAQIEWFINQINDRSIAQGLLVDIFSLLFLKDENDSYVCHIPVAEFVLTMILNIADEPTIMQYAQTGHLHIQVSRLISASNKLDDVIISRKEQLFDALTRFDYQIADHIASLNKGHQKIVSNFKIVHEFSQSDVKLYQPSPKDPEASVEIALSYENQNPSLEFAQNINSLSEEVLKLIKNRINNIHKNHMKCFPLFKAQYMNTLSRRLSRLGATEWNVPSFPKEKSKLKLTVGFFEYLDSLIPSVLKENPDKSVIDVLLVNPYESLEQLVKKGRIDDAEKLAQVVGRDLKVLVFNDSTCPLEVSMHFAEKYPLIRHLLYIKNEEGVDHVPEEPKFLKVALKPKNKSEKMRNNYLRELIMNRHILKPISLNEIEELNPSTQYDLTYSINQNGLTEEESLVLLQKLLNTSPLDRNLISNISYKIDMTTFTDYIRKVTNETNIDEYSEILEDSNIDPNLYATMKMQVQLIKKGIKAFPIEDAFKELISKKLFIEARNLATYNIGNDTFCEILKEIIKYNAETNQPIEPYLRIMPEKKSEFMDFLPKQVQSMVKSEQNNFSASIPEEWRCNQYPNIILSQHISQFDIVIPILEKFVDIDCDDAFINHMFRIVESNMRKSTIDQIKAIHNFINNVIIVFRNKEVLSDKIVDIYVDIFSKIEVYSPDAEEEVLASIHLSIISLQNISKYVTSNEKLNRAVTCLKIIEKILSRMPNTVFSLVYNLHGFGANLASICLKIDLIGCLNRLSQLWDIDITSYQEDYFLTCCSLTLFDRYVEIKDYNQLKQEQKENRGQFMKEVIRILSHPSFVEPLMISTLIDSFPPSEKILSMEWEHKRSSKIKQSNSLSQRSFDSFTDQNLPEVAERFEIEVEETNTHFYPRILTILSMARVPGPTKNQLKIVKRILKTKASTSSLISFFSSINLLEKALKCLEKIENKEDRIHSFKYDICENYLANKSNKLLNKLKKTVKDTELFKSLLPAAGPVLKYQIQDYLGMHKEAVMTAINSFIEATSETSALNFLNDAHKALEKCNQNDFDTKLLLKSINIQRDFCCAVISSYNIKFDGFHDQNVFTGVRQKEGMVLLLFLKDEFETALQLINYYELELSNIVSRITDTLFNESSEFKAIIDFIQKLENFGNENILNEIIYLMTTRIIYTYFENRILFYMSKNLKPKKILCQLMIQFHLIDEAFEYAMKNHYVDLLQLIGNMGQSASNANVVSRCEKELKKTR